VFDIKIDDIMDEKKYKQVTEPLFKDFDMSLSGISKTVARLGAKITTWFNDLARKHTKITTKIIG